jgi:hypothetical protein
MASTNHIGNQRVRHLVVAGVVLLSYGLSIGTSLLLYRQNRELFKLSLDDRLRTVAAVAAAKFDPEVLAELDGPDAVGTPGYKETVLKLQETRLLAEDIRFAYILRRTSSPSSPTPTRSTRKPRWTSTATASSMTRTRWPGPATLMT